MKRTIFFIVFVVLLACLSIGWTQVIHYANQTTIVWDPVTKYADGTAILGTVSYEVYLKDGAQTLLGETSATMLTITLNDYLIHDVGVRAVLTQGGTKYYSELVWSSVDGTPSPFVLQRYPAPAKVENLRIGG